MPRDSFLTLFESRAAQQPAATAVTFERDALTYAQLDALANKLARTLIARGVSTNDAVVLFVPRCLELTVFVLAVLKAGAGYVPLDPNYPEERLAFMLRDSRARVVLTVPGLARSFDTAGLDVIELSLGDARALPESDAPLPRRHGPDDLAYVIYTSGSTGKPKGVAMVHRALDNLIAWQLEDSAAGPNSATLQFAPLSFDVHFQELFATWCSGGRLVLIREQLRFELLNLLALIAQENVERLFLPFIALQSLADIAVAHDKLPSTLREVITAGEQLQITRAIATLFERLPEARLFNHYGPSETHVVTSLWLDGPVKSWPALPAIGYALPEVQLLVLDEQGNEVASGGEGELFVGGVALARGYLHRPELTAERFVTRGDQRLYRTGDLVKELSPGLFQYLGRLDGQVKIRGHRIELGEIEVALSAIPVVREAAVTVHEPRPGDKRLVAYLVLEKAEAPDFRAQLAARLPDAMVPSQFITLPALPRTPSGKVDKRSLPAPTRARPALDVPFEAPRGEHEPRVAQIWSELLAIDELGANDDFFALGGNSLLALRAVAALTRAFGVELPIVQFFERRTIREQASYLHDPAGEATVRRTRELRDPRAPIAIIGMAGRFPGAESSDALFANLLAGVDGITRFERDQLDASALERDDPAYVPARGVLVDADKFDAAFFAVPNNEALVLDPQQRVLLEVAWHALEHAGYAGAASELNVGVYAGTHNNSYFTQMATQRPEAIARVGSFAAMLASEKDYVATRIAHKLDLHGPALSIHTACSTSLVAIATAVEQLRAGMCDVALAGGASITVPQRSGHVYQEGGMLSRDGRTRSFDAEASGTVFSDGAGMVVLKPLARAREDGDTIYAVIRGVGLNNDGGHKASFSAPSVAGQAAAIAMAHEDAGIDPAQLGYVEAHGTATPVGDPIEVEALTRAFGRGEAQFCGLGSIKSNLGHLTAAAGVAGVQKVALALAHEVLPASLGYTRPNPNIDFARTPFFVVAEQRAWPREPGKPRLAGVSSFGVGGTNAHVVLEEAPAHSPSGASAETQLLVLSARSEAALARQAHTLAAHLEAHADTSLADTAYTLARGRAQLPVRRTVVARSAREAAEKLRAASTPSAKPGALAFLFPGQGAQYPAMGENLYRKDPTFRLELDRCAELLTPTLGRDLRELLYGGGDVEAARAALKQTAFTQSALFSVEYALARTLLAWGLRPTVLVGHSVGEFVAACLAGVFDLESGLALVAARGKLMQALPAGAMLSVRASLEALGTIPDGLDLACENTAGACVVGGPREPLLAWAAQLDARGIASKPLETSHAFHTRSVDEAVQPFRALLEQTTLRAPKIRIVSTATGGWLRDEEACDPAYWAQHMRRAVRFRGALDTLFAEPELALLEVGPGKALTTFASYRAPGDARPRALALSTLPGQVEQEAEWSALLSAVGRLWTRGEPLDFRGLYAGEQRRRIALPGTSFERTRHWFDSVPQRPAQVPVASAPVVSPSPVAAGIAPTMSQAPASRRTRLLSELRALIEETSGIDLEPQSEQLDFVELGIDSLAVTQLATRLKKQYGLAIPMRQLIDETSSLSTLAEFLDRTLAPEVEVAPAVSAPAAALPQVALPQLALPQLALPQGNGAPSQLAAQLVQLQITQLTLLQHLLNGAAPSAPVAQAPAHTPPVAPQSPAQGAQPAVMTEPADAKPGQTRYDPQKAFGAIARIYKHVDEMIPRQEARLRSLEERYCAKTQRSKEHTQQNRARHADPRVVTGFKPRLKELIYPLVTSRALGARIWDLDGNEYVDALNGFGSNFFGYSAPQIADALRAQIDVGYEIGPQTPLAGPCADLVCELTGMDRAAFCNTGSEAVMGALRIARTVTGRGLVVVFAGSYHGIFDEVIVRDTKTMRSVPAAPGILPEAVHNVLVLEYGTQQSLEVIRERADEIAAVLVEPVQSRRPDFRPREFLQEVRAITKQAGAALIFDEVITGFRVHPGGAQHFYGIEADLATYGKIVGGGMPIGVIAGRNPWMDALDGGFWQYGDDSTPTAGVTYFAGTFVRHPLAMVAALKALEHMKAEGPALQERLNEKTAAMVKQLNDFFRAVNAPLEIRSFASLWKTFYTEPQPYGELLFCYLRDIGLHIWDGFPCFLTLAHQDADIAFIVSAFTTAVREMQSGGFFPSQEKPANDAAHPPVPGARLGRDAKGNPAWFVANPAEPGKYVMVG